MDDTTIVLRRRPGPRSWLALGAAAAAVLAMLLLIAVACQAANRSGDDTAAPPATPTPDGSPGATGDGTGDDGDGGPDGGEDGGGSGNGQTGGGQDGGGQDGGGQQPTAPTGPVIDYFRVAQEPVCEGTTQTRDLVLEWKVTGTDQVTLSIDGPGVYADYGPEESHTVPFGCAEGRHTYLLTATDSDGTAATGELVVEVPADDGA